MSIEDFKKLKKHAMEEISKDTNHDNAKTDNKSVNIQKAIHLSVPVKKHKAEETKLNMSVEKHKKLPG
jgi:hypothetical protein